MTGLERQQNVRATGWAVPTLTPAPAAGERPRFGLGAACAGNFHPFPRAGGCTLAPVPSPRAAPGPRLARPRVRSRRRVGTCVLAGIAAALPTAPPPEEGGAGLGIDGLGSPQLAHRLQDAHWIHSRPCPCICIREPGVAPSFGELLKHSQLISAGLHGPWSVSGATRVSLAARARLMCPRNLWIQAGKAIHPDTSLLLGTAQLGSKGQEGIAEQGHGCPAWQEGQEEGGSTGLGQD